MPTSPRITDLIEAGLNAAGARSKAIANNIANLNTPGYRRTAVQFEDLLADALEDGRPASLGEVQPELFQPMNTPVDERGNDVNLDTEVGEMIRNGSMYKTYVRLLNKMYRQVELAIRGE